MKGLYIWDVHNLAISNCLFHNNYYQSALIVTKNVSNVTISGREFYQNKGQEYLWIGLSQTCNLTIKNCLFRNNYNQTALIVTKNVSNVTISGCEFYQNKGQEDQLITLLQVRNLTISNCLFNNNDNQYKLIAALKLMWKYSNVNSIKTKIKAILYGLVPDKYIILL